MVNNELNRNDPCYCRSGKKYKNCHLKPYYPHDFFVTKISELDTILLVNKLPSFIELSRSDVYYKDPSPWDAEIHLLLKPLTDLNLDEIKTRK